MVELGRFTLVLKSVRRMKARRASPLRPSPSSSAFVLLFLVLLLIQRQRNYSLDAWIIQSTLTRRILPFQERASWNRLSISTSLLRPRPLTSCHNDPRQITRLQSLQSDSSPATTEEAISSENLNDTEDKSAAQPQQNTLPFFATTSWNTALAVVPPDEAWDQIQRARHEARDASYETWPPAIRLFHPGCSVDETHEWALAIAIIIEEYDVAPFAVTLSKWSIIPHIELMDSDSGWLDATSGSSSSSSRSSSDQPLAADGQRHMSPDEVKAHELIANEERLGREKLKFRQEKQRQKDALAAAAAAAREANSEGTNSGGLSKDNSQTPTSSQKQTDPSADPASSTAADTAESADTEAAFQEFNGPCVICLEPDRESRERLQAVRFLLKHLIPGAASSFADFYTPTSSVAMTRTARRMATSKARRHGHVNCGEADKTVSPQQAMLSDDPSKFRPVVPIAAFATVSSAIGVARKLRKLWQPLTFNVTDLHVLSSLPPSSSSSLDNDDGATESSSDGLLYEYYKRKAVAGGGSSSSSISSQEVTLDQSTEQFGCDALISLVGAEMEMDSDEVNQEMVNTLVAKGESGGFERQQGHSAESERAAAATTDANDSFSGLSQNLEQWLLEDEEYDEGTVLVMGRTQLFTGEMRQYVGMPAAASSILDGSSNSGSGGSSSRGSYSKTA